MFANKNAAHHFILHWLAIKPAIPERQIPLPFLSSSLARYLISNEMPNKNTHTRAHQNSMMGFCVRVREQCAVYFDMRRTRRKKKEIIISGE